MDSDSSEDSYDMTCLICMEDNIDSNSILITFDKCECRKYYHIRCFLNWYNQEEKCIICHQYLSESDINICIYKENEDVWERVSLESLHRIIDICDIENNNIELERYQELDYQYNRNNIILTILIIFVLFTIFIFFFI